MKFTLTLTCDNAAFEDRPSEEIARILRAAASRIEATDELRGSLRDINGNTVGSYEESN